MTMQTDIPVAVSEGVTNRACDSAVSETFEESGSVASLEATLLKSRVLSRGGSPDRQGIMAEEERTNKKVNVEERERKIRLIERRRALSNRIQHDRNETMEKIFAKQNPDGFWNVDDLSVIGISKRNFINFLGNAGARSLGPKVFELALQLLSTLVILAFIKLRLLIDIPLSLPLGKKRELKVDGLEETNSKNITAALRWIKIQEQKIPLLYSRLEFGVNWDVATRNIVQKMAV
ncbi:unnamed protein product [Porites evermanni]|uniref:PARP4 MVP-ID C-terminal domain-containing protein n=1 Tax=Porites evermanni TaxID=104178 RepID=A0ABN8LMD3_9CNID|nr:unnamed protein product [Porites evermanni]